MQSPTGCLPPLPTATGTMRDTAHHVRTAMVNGMALQTARIGGRSGSWGMAGRLAKVAPVLCLRQYLPAQPTGDAVPCQIQQTITIPMRTDSLPRITMRPGRRATFGMGEYARSLFRLRNGPPGRGAAVGALALGFAPRRWRMRVSAEASGIAPIWPSLPGSGSGERPPLVGGENTRENPGSFERQPRSARLAVRIYLTNWWS
jgi:hypothetical protein